MRFIPTAPPRTYLAGYEKKVRISDCGRLHLDPDEQITLTTPSGGEYDVTRKDWGFYATPSLNGRLASFGLRGVLARNRDGRAFILLVEAGREEAFRHYCAIERLSLVAWLDTDQAIVRLVRPEPRLPACPCGAESLDPVFNYSAPPEGEVRFPSASSGYARTVLRCRVCGHFVSRHGMDLSQLYQGEYMDATYGEEGLRRAFEHITGLPPEHSDNEGRAQAVAAFGAEHLAPSDQPPRLLDVGAGLGVFPWRMQRLGWACTALDPDARAARHAREIAGVKAIQADFQNDPVDGQFEVISFNKVLEHVLDPTAMLARALPLLAPGGFVYIELPDAEAAAPHGPEREEFFIDHHHVFSLASLALLAAKAGFAALRVERLREPSGKFTLRGYLGRPQDAERTGVQAKQQDGTP